MKENKGFTLIELLVVIVIIGITLGFALIAFGDFGGSKRIIFAGEQIHNTLRLAQQQAILENSTLGLKINNQGYQVLKFQNAQWRTDSSKHILFKPHSLPNDIIVTIKSNQKSSTEPSVVINSSGETNEFTLIFGTKADPNLAVLSGTDNGELNFKTVVNNGK